ncbi:MAG: hypothetical protein IJY66_06185, partial [Clostridia bacterium]|nr:hypothetical protein [Clostridia bacterium]
MKKFFASFLAVVMLLSCCMLPAYAEDTLLIAPAPADGLLLEDDLLGNQGSTASFICHGAAWNEQFKLFDSGVNTYLVYQITVPATKGAVATVQFMDWEGIGNGGVHQYSSAPKYLCYVTADEIGADFDGNVEGWAQVEANEEIDLETFTYTYNVDSAQGYDDAETLYVCFKFNGNDVSYEGQSGWNDGAWVENISFTAKDYTGIILYDGKDQDALNGGTPDDQTFAKGSETVAAICKDFSTGSSVDQAGIMAQINLDAKGESIDVSDMDFFRFDLYVEDFGAASSAEWCVELTSSGKCDEQEHQYLGTFAGMGAGWNTVTLRLGSFQDKGMDLTKFNYFRLFNNSSISSDGDFVFKIDNVRFEKAEEVTSDYTGPLEEYLFIVLDNDSELNYLVRSSASTSGTAFRFCDGTTEVVYKYSIINRYSATKVQFTAMLSQQLLLQVSQDDENWQTVWAYEYDESKNPDQGMGWNKTMTFDLTPYLDLAACPDIYVRVADSYSSNGWGGTIHSDIAVRLEVQYKEMTPEEWDAYEAAPDDRSISLLTCSKPFGKFQPDASNKTAGYSSAALQIAADNVNAITFDPIDSTGYDALEFDMYVTDPSLLEATFKDTGIELSSAGKCDDGELSWKFPDIVTALDGKIEEGWNHVTLLFRDGKPDSRNQTEFDPTAINYLRFFFVGVPEEYHGNYFAVDNFRLTTAAAEKDAAQAAADQKAADRVIKLINSIGEVTEKSERAITKAENAFNDLTDAQKALVSNADV